MITLAQVLRRYGSQYLSTHSLSESQAKAWRAIAACRSAALGGQCLACKSCSHEHWQYHSCRNRHCPQCGARAKEAWLAARLSQVLEVPYAHMVFTLPHEINGLYVAHKRWVIEALFASVSETLKQFAADPKWLGATPAFTLVLHTWTQDLRLHLHLHALVSCGGLRQDTWVSPVRSDRFLFPVHALSRVMRGKFLDKLRQAHRGGDLPRDPQGDPVARGQRLKQLHRHDWVVYAKTPFSGAAQTSRQT